MMDNIHNIIADRQYQGALESANATIRPMEPFPIPTPEEYKYFLRSHSLDLQHVLDSPIGVFCFKEFLKTFSNHSYIVDFLVQFERLKKIDAPELSTAQELMDIATELPGIYSNDVNKIWQKIRDLEAEKNEIDVDLLDLKEMEKGFEKTLKKKDGKHFSVIGSGGNIVSFGGLGLGNNYNNKNDDFVISSVDVEIMNEDSSEGLDRGLVLRQQNLARKSHMKRNCLALFSELAAILEQKANDLLETFKDSERYTQMVNAWWYSERKLNVKDFILFRDLGRGAFGVVSSAKTKTTGTLTAIKCLNKRLIKGKKAKRLVTVEKQILEKLGDNPSSFTVWLKYAFQDPEVFYMALPLCTGGDLGFHLKRKGNFPVPRARFHTAEILEGLVHLHNLGIIYRDLKPDNIIVDMEGHCRISDMGLATITNGKRIRGRAGTPGYWAPEVISKQHYSFSADYWSLGCILFEMCVGLCPFSSTNTGLERDEATLYWEITFPRTLSYKKLVRPKPKQTHQSHEDSFNSEFVPESETNVAGNANANLKFVKETIEFPSDLEDLLYGLLERDRSRRLNEEEVKAHRFFAGLDWSKLKNCEETPPWKPRKDRINAAAISDLDFSNNEQQYRKVKLTKEDEIDGFDYISKYAHQMDIVNVMKTQEAGKLKYESNYEASCCCPM